MNWNYAENAKDARGHGSDARGSVHTLRAHNEMGAAIRKLEKHAGTAAGRKLSGGLDAAIEMGHAAHHAVGVAHNDPTSANLDVAHKHLHALTQHLESLPNTPVIRGAWGHSISSASSLNAHARSQTNNEGYHMRLTDQQRRQIIHDLTTNCECWSERGDEDVLNSFHDDKLVALRDHAYRSNNAVAVANSAMSGFSDGGTAYRVNSETGRWEKRQVTNEFPGQGPVVSPGNSPTPPRSAGRVSPSVSPHRPDTTRHPPQPTDDHTDRNDSGRSRPDMDRAGDDGMDDDEDHVQDRGPLPPRRTAPSPQAPHGPPPAANRRNQSPDAWLRGAPVEVQNMVRAAQEVERREKDKVISQLLVNVHPNDKQAHYARLVNRPLQDLQDDLAMMPKVPSAEEAARTLNASQPTNGNGRGNGRRTVRSSGGGEDMLVAPTINYGSSGEATVPGASGQETVTENAEDYANDDEQLQNLSPRLRSVVNNAMAIEAREKRKVIEQLTANVVDDDQLARMSNTLSNKPLDELKMMLALVPRQDRRPAPVYFGAAGGPVGNQRFADANEDVLPIPRMDFSKQA